MQPKLAHIAGHPATAWIAPAICILLSAAAAYWTANQVEHEARLKFETAVTDAHAAIESRIHAYSDVLLGIRGLFIASDSVTRDEFRDYIGSLDLNRRYPGIQVIHYGQRVAAAQKQAFEAMVRNDTSVNPRGYPDFAVKPPGDRPEYVIVQYVEPMAGNEIALGLDLSGDRVRLAALERTRDSGRITASGIIALALDPRRHPGFAMRVPVYRKGMPLATVAQRREAFTGVVSASFVVIDLMRGMLSEQLLQKIHVRIHDAGFLDSPGGLQPPTAENLMFDSDRLLPAPSSQPASSDGKPADLTSMSGLDIGGRRWNLYFNARQEFIAPSDRWLPWVTLLGGITISLLLFGLTRSLATSGSRAIKLADRITEDLRKSEASLAEAQRTTQQLIETLPNPIFFKGRDGRYLGVNKAWEKFFGLPRDTFIGKTVHDLYPNDPEVAKRLHADDQVLWDHPGTKVYETAITTPDGRRHDAIYYKATFTRADGSIAGLIGTIIDITERKDLERRFQLTFDYAAIGIVHTSLDRRILLANRKFLDITGYSLEELRQLPPAGLADPKEADSDAHLERQLLEGKIDTYVSERRYISKHGRLISTKRATSVARDASGTPQYYIRVVEDVTETKLNEERYRAMFENAAVGITRSELNGVLVDVNQKFCDLLGYSRDELIGKAVKDITHPDDYGQGAAYRDQITRGAMESAVGEKRFVRKDGAILWARRTMSLVRDDAGNPQYIISVVEDITERKRAEEALRTSEETLRAANAQLQMLVQSSPLAIYTRDTKGLLTSWNPAAEKMYGWNASEVLGKPLPSVPDEARPESDGLRTRLLAGETFIKQETQRRRRDGNPIDIDAFLSPLRDAAGNVNGIIAVVADITDRKQAEKALRDSETRYRSMIAALAEGIILRDKNARIIDCNAGAERILGRTLDQMRGNTYFDPSWEAIREDGSLFPGDERPANAALRTGKPQSGVVIGLRKPDGAVLWLAMNAQPLFEESATTPSGVVTTITDITRHKQAESLRAMEHNVTRVLAEAETLAEAIPDIIRIICETMEWHCGQRWEWDKANGLLRCIECWGIDTPEIREFMASNAKLAMKPVSSASVQGLVRRIHSTGEAAWIDDISRERNLQRTALVIKAGLHGAFGFPLLLGDEVLGVMEFFHRDIRKPDDVLMQVARSIGNQIGQLIARKQAEERIRHLAHYDELTELPNRTMFNHQLARSLAQARRHDKPLAVLFIDLDRFKNINDTLGHEAGDCVLKEVAERLRGCLRDSDTVGRLGGDEFVVLLEELPQPVYVATVAQKILAAVAKPFILDAQEFHLTASIGISTYPADSSDLHSLLKNADISMYRAKEQGKNNYQFYSAQMNVHTIERLALESSLRRAVERSEFQLHYQPKVDIRSGYIIGMEALVRWQQPGQGLIPPAQFIPLAEETGLIVPIGEWVLKTACARNKSWQEQGLPPLRIAVNLSGRQFAHETLLQDVTRVLNETGMDPVLLELEITESMAMHDPGYAVKLMTKLKAMGVHLSIDDFGTGYSSLGYLKRFPIDSVKIDRSFIRDLPGDSDDAAITQAIIAMAHGLKLRVVAEGVETGEQLSFLRAHGCDEMQGYYFSKPLPEHEFFLLAQNGVAPGAAHSPG
jgi:diguanylate cyclase (GGDEF)-like protein/PAS domain S-box-containing protein